MNASSQTPSHPAVLWLDYVPGRVMPRHDHDYANVTLVVRGSIRETAGRRGGEDEADAAALSVVIKPPGVPHADVVGPCGCSTRVIKFDPAEMLPEPGRLAYGWHHGGPVAAAAVNMFAAGDKTASLGLAHVLELAIDQIERSSRAGDAVVAERTRDMLRELWDQPISTRDLAEEVGVHPVYLARAFRRRFGTTMHGYVHRLRACRAAELLSAGQPAAAIAACTGFADQAHFSRSFKRHAGTTPRGYGRLARQV